MEAEHNKLLEWTDAYELGVEDMDLQHHYFLNLINRINHLIQDSTHQIYTTRLISELNAYARFHFISEENLMLASGYQGYAEHKRLHKELIEQLTLREKQLESHPNFTQALQETVKFLADWFADHTLREDKRFTDYITTN